MNTSGVIQETKVEGEAGCKNDQGNVVYTVTLHKIVSSTLVFKIQPKLVEIRDGPETKCRGHQKFRDEKEHASRKRIMESEKSRPGRELPPSSPLHYTEAQLSVSRPSLTDVCPAYSQKPPVKAIP